MVSLDSQASARTGHEAKASKSINWSCRALKQSSLKWQTSVRINVLLPNKRDNYYPDLLSMPIHKSQTRTKSSGPVCLSPSTPSSFEAFLNSKRIRETLAAKLQNDRRVRCVMPKRAHSRSMLLHTWTCVTQPAKFSIGISQVWSSPKP